MALGPQAIPETWMAKAIAAEARIDFEIRRSSGVSLAIYADGLGIDRAIWEMHLKPRYKAAGWKVADWTYGRDGDFINLQP